MNTIENWADVEALIRGLLPPGETVSELFEMECTGGVSVATREWLERVQAMRQSLSTATQTAHNGR